MEGFKVTFKHYVLSVHMSSSPISQSPLPFLGDSRVVILSSPERDDRKEEPSQSPCRKVFSDKEGTHKSKCDLGGELKFSRVRDGKQSA